MTTWNVTNDAELQKLVEEHQGLLSGDVIIGVVAAIPTQFADDLRTKLLQAVVFYHQQHKGPQDWNAAYDRFSKLLNASDNPWVKFYVYNYCFLAGRKANLDTSLLEHLFTEAELEGEWISEPQRSQLYGFLYYNYARYLLTQNQNSRALEMWQEATASRLRWYTHVLASGGEEVALKSAATQVWKMRADFNSPNFFPDRGIECCGIGDVLFAEVAKLADPNFSAQPKS